VPSHSIKKCLAPAKTDGEQRSGVNIMFGSFAESSNSRSSDQGEPTTSINNRNMR